MTTRTAGIPGREYRKRMRAWTWYDWANSAFATVVLGAVLPAYYSEVAGATLSSPATATAYWATGLAVSYLIVALLSPLVGTVSDVVRGKKILLAFFTAVGVTATAALVLVSTGDWLLATLLFGVGQVGFWLSSVLYDSLLPHVATERDLDRVSARGYAMGYLGGGLVLVMAAVLILALPEEGHWGVRLAFVGVAVWWAAFSLPVLRSVPEPPTASARIEAGSSVVGTSIQKLRATLADMGHFRQLRRYLVAFLLIENGIGTVIALAVIYAAELGFGTTELILALVLVQFVGIPFTLLFGRLPARDGHNRSFVLTFLIFNLVALPAIGIAAAYGLDRTTVGRPAPAFQTTAAGLGEGDYQADDPRAVTAGVWQVATQAELGRGARTDYLVASAPGARIDFPYNGQEIRIVYGEGPDHGIWADVVDGRPALDDDEPLTVDAYNTRARFGVPVTVDAGTAGPHIVSLIVTGDADSSSTGTVVSVGEFTVLPPVREASLLTILGLLAAVQGIGLAVAWVAGKAQIFRTGRRIDTKQAILLGVVFYVVIAVWGYFLDSAIEFWFLAWMVAVVQGGSQSLARSLFASMSPVSQSGEFFGLYNAMSRLAAVFSPLLFAAAVAIFGSSRPAVLSLAVIFVAGALVLRSVDVDEGRSVARDIDEGAVRYPRHVEGGLAHYGRTITD